MLQLRHDVPGDHHRVVLVGQIVTVHDVAAASSQFDRRVEIRVGKVPEAHERLDRGFASQAVHVLPRPLRRAKRDGTPSRHRKRYLRRLTTKNLCSSVTVFVASPYPRSLPAGVGAKGKQSLQVIAVSYTHLRAHETDSYLVCRL